MDTDLMWSANGTINPSPKCMIQTKGYTSKFLENNGALLPTNFQ